MYFQSHRSQSVEYMFFMNLSGIATWKDIMAYSVHAGLTEQCYVLLWCQTSIFPSCLGTQRSGEIQNFTSQLEEKRVQHHFVQRACVRIGRAIGWTHEEEAKEQIRFEGERRCYGDYQKLRVHHPDPQVQKFFHLEGCMEVPPWQSGRRSQVADASEAGCHSHRQPRSAWWPKCKPHVSAVRLPVLTGDMAGCTSLWPWNFEFCDAWLHAPMVPF